MSAQRTASRCGLAVALIVVAGIPAMAISGDSDDSAGRSTRACPAASVLVAQGTSDYWEEYYGGAHWPEMTAALDAAAATVTVAPDLEDLDLMMGFDALWVDHRGYNSLPTSFLTATEVNNISDFVASGRRVVLHGENPGWSSWNSQILAIVGGTFAGGSDSTTATPVLAHELTAGVSQINVPAPGLSNGGTPLFDPNVITLWEKEKNVLTILEINAQSTFYWGNLDNSTFFTNVAEWVGCRYQVFADGFEAGNTGAWDAVVP